MAEEKVQGASVNPAQEAFEALGLDRNTQRIAMRQALQERDKFSPT